jgi:hypothetical protein
MAWTKGVLILLFALLMSASAHTTVAQPAQIILLRHAEKPADPEDPHLSPAGVKRAERLVSFIMTDPVMSRFGLPVAVFATQSTKHGNGQRTQETVAPLARALKLPVQTPFLSKDYSALAKLILANPAYAGKTVLICWNHEEITQLAGALGVKSGPQKWKGSVFDKLYVISYQNRKPTLATFHYDGT